MKLEDYSKYYIQGSDHYLVPKDIFKELFNEMVNWKEENEELKKQFEEKDILIKQCDLSVSKVMDCYCERTDCSGRIKDSKQYDSLVQKVENQQQEFIKYLEDKEKQFDRIGDPINAGACCGILIKYKEIIGDEVNDKK